MRRLTREAQAALNGHTRDLDLDYALAVNRLQDDGYLRDHGGLYARKRRLEAPAVEPWCPDDHATLRRKVEERLMLQADLLGRGGRKRNFAVGRNLRPTELSYEGAIRSDHLPRGGWQVDVPDTSGVALGRPKKPSVDRGSADSLVENTLRQVASTAGFVLNFEVLAGSFCGSAGDQPQ
jgi:hypothetical protein